MIESDDFIPDTLRRLTADRAPMLSHRTDPKLSVSIPYVSLEDLSSVFSAPECVTDSDSSATSDGSRQRGRPKKKRRGTSRTSVLTRAEQMRDARRRWRDQNPGNVQDWRERHPEAARARWQADSKRHRAINTDAAREAQARYHEAHREARNAVHRERNGAYRAALPTESAIGHLSAAMRRAVA